jgi:hypothetical protein
MGRPALRPRGVPDGGLATGYHPMELLMRTRNLFLALGPVLIAGFVAARSLLHVPYLAREFPSRPPSTSQSAPAGMREGRSLAAAPTEGQLTTTMATGITSDVLTVPSSQMSIQHTAATMRDASGSSSREGDAGPLGVSGGTRSTTDSAYPLTKKDLQEAIHHFQANPNDRTQAAQKLLPFLKPGMDKHQIEEILGKPSRGLYSEPSWFYVLFYSQFIDVYFDEEGRVTRVISTVTTQPGESG